MGSEAKCIRTGVVSGQSCSTLERWDEARRSKGEWEDGIVEHRKRIA